MNIRRLAPLAAAVAVAGLAFGASAQQQYTFRMATIAPKTAVYNTDISDPFAAHVARLTDGKVKVEVFEGGVLAPIFKIYEAVEDGRADIAVGPPTFLGGQDPTNLIISSFPSGLGVDSLIPWLYLGGGQQMLTQHRREKMKMHSLILGAGPSEIFAHSHKAIRTVEDLKGVKFRTLGNWAAILKDGFGAAPVVVPGSELYGMLEKKGIDAMEYSMPSENKALGYQEVARYIIMPGIHAGAWSFEVVMKMEKWDALPKDIQDKIAVAAKLTTYESLHSIVMKDFAALEELMKGKNEIIILDDTFKNKVKDASRKWAFEAAAKAKTEGNPWPERVAKSVFDFQDRWAKLSPYMVMDHRFNFQ
ncbi:MAG: C4-dicarboxylate ABC transporter substrate-binding protein [Alphaproteobacteria bacterium]|nr:C4-dicarboxylate ABC transporter substrate-binding protein [Alphaproteobacteria bacterium]